MEGGIDESIYPRGTGAPPVIVVRPFHGRGARATKQISVYHILLKFFSVFSVFSVVRFYTDLGVISRMRLMRGLKSPVISRAPLLLNRYVKIQLIITTTLLRNVTKNIR